MILAGRREEAAWLEPTTSETEIDALLQASAPELLVPRAVGFAVSDARYDGPHCLDDAEPDPQGALFTE